MATMTKVTITVPTRSVEAIRALVAAGRAKSVSGFVQHAIQVSLDDVAGWGVMLAQALRDTGGEITPAERAWADGVLGEGEFRATAEAIARYLSDSDSTEGEIVKVDPGEVYLDIGHRTDVPAGVA